MSPPPAGSREALADRSASVPAVRMAIDASKDGLVDNHVYDELVDAARMNHALLVLRVRLIATEGGDKWAWDRVQVLHVFKNTTGHECPSDLRVAHYSGQLGVPAGESTLYLDPYDDSGRNTLWKLLDGSARRGVTHER